VVPLFSDGTKAECGRSVSPRIRIYATRPLRACTGRNRQTLPGASQWFMVKVHDGGPAGSEDGFMDAVMMQLSETVSDERGTFHARVMARERDDGSWEGWLEFVRPDKESCGYATPIETRQHDRVTLERWASGLTDPMHRDPGVGSVACAAGTDRGVGPPRSARRACRRSDDRRRGPAPPGSCE
jgi:hypothetical protein